MSPRPVIIGRHATAELFVAERITKEVERIARDPETRAPEPDVPGLPAGAIARRATVSGYTIRWVYFVRGRRRAERAPGLDPAGRRKALEDPAYLLRWLEERARHKP